MTNTDIYIASDHRGFSLKGAFVAWLCEKGYTPHDLGPDNDARCDASTFAVKLAAALKKNPEARGVLICGTGQAMAMTANRFQHLRAALCTDTTSARLTREHNDANVLVLGADVVGRGIALGCLDVFLNTKFLQGRYAERCKMLADMGGL
jgi:ribose 5-phosphate isomerase B